MEEEIIKTIQKVKQSVITVSTTVLVPHEIHGIIVDTHPAKGIGSGFIIDKEGYVLTNNHVIQGANEVELILGKDKTCSGKVIGGDATTDVAVIKIDKNIEFLSASLGDSDKVQVGQSVFAIGSPLGLIGEPTVTRGVISALTRSIETPNFLIEDLIQTDAAINPGNSGGPLITLDGKVIAINTAIVPFAQGIGFAIPINLAKNIAKELIDHGKIIRPYIGIVGIDITNEIMAYYKLPVPQGAIVARIGKESPAEKSGLLPGDIIVQAGDHDVKRMKDLLTEVGKNRPGDSIEVTVLRNGKEKNLMIKLEAPPEA